MGWLCSAAVAEKASPALPTAAELLPRAIVSEGDLTRLQRVLAKARRGKKITVGIIGGSITAGASASTPEKHYSGVLLHWLKKTFPKTQFDLVNAGIGATGSDYGCLRVRHDLLSHNPDLVVVEFACNDRNTQESAETYEGLLRQVLAHPNQPAVIQLFMVVASGIDAQEWHTKVASHYNLPQVSYRNALWPEVAAGRIAWRQLSPDDAHPNDTGHAYAGEFLAGLLDRALRKLPADGKLPASPPLPKPLLTDAYQFTSLNEAKELKPAANRGWALQDGNWGLAWRSSIPGSAIEFKVFGTQVFLSFFRIRGAMGKVHVYVDNAKPMLLDAWFDGTWGGYRQTTRIAKDLAPGMHRVRVELLTDKHPKSTGTDFQIMGLGAGGIGQ